MPRRKAQGRFVTGSDRQVISGKPNHV
jgi:hypothetical protein